MAKLGPPLRPPAPHSFGVACANLGREAVAAGKSMLRTVGGSIQQLQVLNPVVCLDTVPVVDTFTRQEQAPDHGLHDVPVFEDISLMGIRVSGHSQHDVAEVVDVPPLAAPDASIAVVIYEPRVRSGHAPAAALTGVGLLAGSRSSRRSGAGKMVTCDVSSNRVSRIDRTPTTARAIHLSNHNTWSLALT